MNYYVYTFADPDSGIVKYVGQGKGKRCNWWRRADKGWEFKYGVKPWLWSLKKAGREPFVTKILEGLMKGQADTWEVGLIDFIGRKCKGTGPLLNIADGGAGVRGYKQSAESIRKRIGPKCSKILEGHVAKARKMANENGGKLQNYEWLRKNGHKGLALTIRRHPEAFTGIEQVRKRQPLKTTIAKAKRMAEMNGGKLQNYAWLRNNGHSDVAEAVRKVPKALLGFVQDNKCKPLEETVVKAQAMAEANGGKLQHSRWLQNNGHCDIVQAMKYHPEAFIGINRVKRKNQYV
jgi:hypothetical protein